MGVLTPQAIADALTACPGWTHQDGRLVVQRTFADFVGALAYVNAVGQLAEAQQHHPDIVLHYNQVTLTLWSHDVDALTDRDIRLAQAISVLP